MVSVWKDIDTSSARVFLKIQETCETVFVTDHMESLYVRLLKEVASGERSAPTLLNSLGLYFRWRDLNKAQVVPATDLPKVSGEEAFEEEDREFIRLALKTGALLITHDKTILELAKKFGYKASLPSNFDP
jgi:hypothetical protein